MSPNQPEADPLLFRRPFVRAAAGALFLFSVATLAETPAETHRDPAVLEISPGIYRLGQMRLDKNTHALSFPATVNMQDGLIEYLLVSPRGSVHESLLSTEAQASDIHFAMLLLGVEAAPASDAPLGSLQGGGQINADSLRNEKLPRGASIRITIKWREGTQEKTVPIEDWVRNTESQKAMERGPWIYTGSQLVGQTFAAQVTGDLAAVVLNPGALINNPRNGNQSDQIWWVNRAAVPPLGTPVELTITLLRPNP